MGFWRSFAKEWFAFSKAERQGIWVLVIIVVCAVVVAKLYPETSVVSADPTLVEEANRINALLVEDVEEPYRETPTHNVTPAPLSLSLFNPNDVSVEQLQNMGIPERAIKSLIGYRSKGGVFRKAEDIKKLYGITPELSAALMPFVVIPDSSLKKGFKLLYPKRDSTNVADKLPVEINGADSASLLLIKGIGPVLARKIIAYRNRLGGFYCREQLLDIYGLRAENLLQMQEQFTIDTTKLLKWSFNALSPDSLAKHPYMSKYQANAVGFYRGKVGKIRSLEELVRNRILPPEAARKLRPYVKF